jgi:nicotinamide riboside kinase
MSRLFVTTGPEASGKTTLAAQLSASLQAPLVTEVSREYLTALYAQQPGYRYGESDLLAIAHLQLNLETQALQRNPAQLVCDTDLLVIVIWSEVVFGTCAPALMRLFEDSLAATRRHYLLCDYRDVAWEADPLRENPHDRDRLFERYVHKLQTLGASFTLVSGSKDERLEQALRWAVDAEPC